MKIFNKVLIVALFVGFFDLAFAQDVKLPGLDVSPMDVALLRVNGNTDPIAKIFYCRPHRNGRTVFSNEGKALVPYDKLWRTGANETTEVKFFKDVKLGGVDVKAGTYSLYTIPGENEWTLILNSKLDTWGHFMRDESKDVYKCTGKSRNYEKTVEDFTIHFAPFDKGENSSTLYMAWENTIVEFPIEF